MKKEIALCMALLLAVSFMTGCGKNENAAEETSPAAETQNAEETKTEHKDAKETDAKGEAKEGEEAKDSSENSGRPEVSENKDVVNEKKAPKIFWIADGEGTDALTYHLKGCEALEGKEVHEIAWEMASQIGFWQCAKCNPPRYEGYTNAE